MTFCFFLMWIGILRAVSTSDDASRLGSGDPKLYRYVDNSPTNWTDRLGIPPLTALDHGFRGGAGALTDVEFRNRMAGWDPYFGRAPLLTGRPPDAPHAQSRVLLPDHLDCAIALAQEGRFNESITEFNQAIAPDPKNAAAYRMRGYAYLFQHKHTLAIKDFSKAITLDRRHTSAYAGRAEAYCQIEDYQRAIEDYNELLHIDPGQPMVYNHKGYLHMREGRFEEAIRDYNKCLSLDPKIALAYYNRGAAYMNLREYERALADFNEALRLNPKDADAYCARGYIYIQGEYERAMADFDKALKVDPKHFWAYRNRAVAFWTARDYERALADFQHARRIKPEDAGIYDDLARFYIFHPDETRRDDKQAVKLATRACELSTWKNTEYIETLASAYALRGDYEQAAKSAEKALKLAPESNKAHYRSLIDLYRSRKGNNSPER